MGSLIASHVDGHKWIPLLDVPEARAEGIYRDLVRAGRHVDECDCLRPIARLVIDVEEHVVFLGPREGAVRDMQPSDAGTIALLEGTPAGVVEVLQGKRGRIQDLVAWPGANKGLAGACPDVMEAAGGGQAPSVIVGAMIGKVEPSVLPVGLAVTDPIPLFALLDKGSIHQGAGPTSAEPALHLVREPGQRHHVNRFRFSRHHVAVSLGPVRVLDAQMHLVQELGLPHDPFGELVLPHCTGWARWVPVLFHVCFRVLCCTPPHPTRSCLGFHVPRLCKLVPLTAIPFPPRATIALCSVVSAVEAPCPNVQVPWFTAPFKDGPHLPFAFVRLNREVAAFGTEGAKLQNLGQ
mmetsp:Transcript_111328/g.310028  ORF Transcript_111328/g.310028 Transcript_111328/m.310028 type:complete len:350 (-) Transcript_111328:1464-2513(-)